MHNEPLRPEALLAYPVLAYSICPVTLEHSLAVQHPLPTVMQLTATNVPQWNNNRTSTSKAWTVSSSVLFANNAVYLGTVVGDFVYRNLLLNDDQLYSKRITVNLHCTVPS